MSEKRVKINRGVKRILENLTFDNKDIHFMNRYPKALDKHINARRELIRKYPDIMKLL